MAIHSVLSLLLLACMCMSSMCTNGLYWAPHKKCKDVEKIVDKAVEEAMKKDIYSATPLLAMHFVDCMVNGCDGSAILKKAGAERDLVQFLDGFELIDKIKAKVDKACGVTVSCADILTAAARSVVVYLGGPYWKVQFGRLDGEKSTKEAAAKWVPGPFSTPSKGADGGAGIKEMFARVGLKNNEFVSLSGAHTVGRGHCTSVGDRYTTSSPTAPISSDLKEAFKKICKKAADFPPFKGPEFDMSCGPQGKVPPTGGNKFDNAYYKNLLKKKGVLTSDQSLWSGSTKDLVEKYAMDQEAWFQDFAEDMVKMAAITPSSLKKVSGGPAVPVYPNNKYGIRAGKCSS